MPVRNLPYLFPGWGPIWLCGVEAGVGGFRSPGASVRELLLDCGVLGPCREPELAAEIQTRQKTC